MYGIYDPCRGGINRWGLSGITEWGHTCLRLILAQLVPQFSSKWLLHIIWTFSKHGGHKVSKRSFPSWLSPLCRLIKNWLASHLLMSKCLNQVTQPSPQSGWEVTLLDGRGHLWSGMLLNFFWMLQFGNYLKTSSPREITLTCNMCQFPEYEHSY